MRSAFALPSVLLMAVALRIAASAQDLQFPKTVEAGSAFSVPASGNGDATLYIVGPAQVLRKTIKMGQNIPFERGQLTSAGHYTAFLVGPEIEAVDFDVTPSPQPSSISFLAKPSRLAVDRHDGISGVAYLFDLYRNLILKPLPVSFQLSGTASPVQVQKVDTRNGVAWVKMNSASRSGTAQFEANAAGVTGKRVIEQVPGDPCNLRISARPVGDRIELQTDPVRDCSGNPVPDGTIISFTEAYNGTESTVDAPLKRGIAKTTLPANKGAVITVAAGVVMGNEIRWQ